MRMGNKESTAEGMNKARIIRLRNDLCLWAMGQLALSLDDLKKRIYELDKRLQAQDL